MTEQPWLRVSLAFARMRDAELLAEAETILTNLYGNAFYPEPPVTQEKFAELVDTYRTKLVECADGGPPATAAKNEARRNLCDCMRELAYYVQVKGHNVLSVLLSSGFKATSRNRVSEPLPAPIIDRLFHGQTGEILLTAKRVPNARCYERQVALVKPDGNLEPFRNLPISNGARRMSTTGLVPGQRYSFRIRAVGGSTEYSDWSDVATIMCL